ncbi:MAG TPA: hypothetical protein VFT27_06435, partial [Actinomycetota bacterium]|nr:hypothetical protein [Actinomycetota bacterium]
AWISAVSMGIGQGGPMIRRAVAIAALSVIAMSGSPAFAYVDRGSDPQEGSGQATVVDIGRSIRRLHPTEHGRKLGIVIIPYELANNSYDIHVYLDSRGGHRADFWLDLDNTEGPRRCHVYRRGRHEPVARCRIIEGGNPGTITRIKARFPARYVHPNKRIRWRIVAVPLNENWSDRAPDRGWYPE